MAANVARMEEFAECLLKRYRQELEGCAVGPFEYAPEGVGVPVPCIPGGSNFALRMGPKGGTVVRLYLFAADPDQVDRGFAELKRHRQEIQSDFGPERLSWRQWTYGATVEIRNRGSLGMDEANWPDLQEEMIDWYKRLRAAVDPHLEEVGRQMRQPNQQSKST